MGEPVIARTSVPAGAADPVGALARGLGPGPFALVLLFLSPGADLARIARETGRIPAAEVVGCTTAGEIAAGYTEGQIVAIGFPARHFAAETLLIPDLDRIARAELAGAFLRARQRLAEAQGHLPHECAILLVDGLSVREDELAAALAGGAGSIPLVGGSAGDGDRFGETFLLYRGRILRHAAVLSVLRGACPVRALNMDHLRPTERRMVVTEADPSARIVRQINAEPAAREYARLLGLPPEGLESFTFAAHPLAVRMGARHHVRAIQRRLPDDALLFYAAIDRGMVLSITEPGDLTAHMEAEFDRLRRPAPPTAILAFDCILRRVEAEGKQLSGRVSEILQRHGVWGFSTYGEQIGPLHVNHTLTGCVFYPPGTVVPA